MARALSASTESSPSRAAARRSRLADGAGWIVPWPDVPKARSSSVDDADPVREVAVDHDRADPLPAAPSARPVFDPRVGQRHHRWPGPVALERVRADRCVQTDLRPGSCPTGARRRGVGFGFGGPRRLVAPWRGRQSAHRARSRSGRRCSSCHRRGSRPRRDRARLLYARSGDPSADRSRGGASRRRANSGRTPNRTSGASETNSGSKTSSWTRSSTRLKRSCEGDGATNRC